jgi:hypothetical protein
LDFIRGICNRANIMMGNNRCHGKERR